MKKILFVCTGNTCRSPMAEALFRHRIGEGMEWEADSAGLYAANGSPASTNAIQALEELGIDLTKHQSKFLDPELAEEADLIVPMTASHRFDLLQNFPEVGNRVCLIKSFGTGKVPADISDPFGGSLDIYRETRDEIDRAISDLVLFLRAKNR
jgi:protein-tyrosine-phosphatase